MKEGVSKDKETVVPEHRGGVEPITTGMDCYNVQNWKFGTAKRTMYYDYMYYHCCQKLKREVSYWVSPEGDFSFSISP